MKMMAALRADFRRRSAMVPLARAFSTCSAEAVTSLLVAMLLSLLMLLCPSSAAPRRIITAMMMTAVRYRTTRVATAVPKALAASLVPRDQPMNRPAASSK